MSREFWLDVHCVILPSLRPGIPPGLTVSADESRFISLKIMAQTSGSLPTESVGSLRCHRALAAHYHSPKVHTGPHPPDKCLWLVKCAVTSRALAASSTLRSRTFQTTGAAPLFNSSHRGQPASLLPKFAPWLCFVVMVSSMRLLITKRNP